MKFWGITGTNGKTTTTWIFAEFLNATQASKQSDNPNSQTVRKCGYVTTVEVNTGSRRFYTGYTTPPLAQLKEIFAEMEANGCTDCVMEVSSHAIHQHRTGDTVFSGGVFTNLSEDHLDYHKTMEAYFDVKLDFARQIAAAHKATPDMGRKDLPPYVVCLDGGYGTEMFNAVGNLAVNVIGVSAATARATSMASTASATSMASTASATSMASPSRTTGPRPNYDLSELQLVGDYNRSNVLCAAALAEAAGVPHDVIQKTIPTLKPRWGRLEEVKSKSEKVKARVFVDFAHTPDGLEKVLSAVRKTMQGPTQVFEYMSREEAQSNNRTIEQSNNSLWVVFGAGGDRDPMKRPLMGEACAKLADKLVVTSDNPRSEDPLKIIDAILVGVNRTIGESERSNNVFVEPDRRKAIEFALANAAEGDVVIIAGKGHETTQEIKGVKYPFDDRETVREYTK